MNQSARYLNLILGIWLILSAFIWPHSPAQVTNAIVVGVLFAIFALIALRLPAFRFPNAILAIWLFISSWTLPSGTSGTIWNNVIVSIVVFVVSLVPSHPHHPTTLPPAAERPV